LFFLTRCDPNNKKFFGHDQFRFTYSRNSQSAQQAKKCDVSGAAGEKNMMFSAPQAPKILGKSTFLFSDFPFSVRPSARGTRSVVLLNQSPSASALTVRAER